jgi:hypothetical protein
MYNENPSKGRKGGGGAPLLTKIKFYCIREVGNPICHN